MKPTVATALLVIGALCIAGSQVNLPSVEPFESALAWMGYSLAAIARADSIRDGLMSITNRGQK